MGFTQVRARWGVPVLAAGAALAIGVGTTVALTGGPFGAGSGGGPEPLRLQSGGAGGVTAGAAEDSRLAAGSSLSMVAYARYRLEGGLPEGPNEAAVARLGGADADGIAALVGALGMRGTAAETENGWELRDGGSVLWVEKGGSGTWSFTREDATVTAGSCEATLVDPVPADAGSAAGSAAGGGDTAVSSDGTVVCSSVTEVTPDGGTAIDAVPAPDVAAAPAPAPIPLPAPDLPPTPTPTPEEKDVPPVPEPVAPPAPSEDEVRAAAGAVLALVEGGGDVQFADGWGSRTALVRPEVDGLVAFGLETEVTVDAAGIQWAHGWIGSVTTGENYPLASATDVFAQLTTNLPQAEMCVDPGPALGAPEGVGVDGAMPMEGGCGEIPETVVTGASLALTMDWDATGPLLVPAWAFHIADGDWPALRVAVDPAYLAPFEDPAAEDLVGGDAVGGGSSGSSGSGSDSSGSDSGVATEPAAPLEVYQSLTAGVGEGERDISLTFTAVECVYDDYSATVEETPSAVLVTIAPVVPDGPAPEICRLAETRTLTVTLTEPLGDRQLLDAGSGTPIERS